MSQPSTEGQGQAPAEGQGSNAAGPGQEPDGGNGTQGQEPGAEDQGQGQDGSLDLSAIQDPAVRAVVERMDREMREARQEAARYRTERNQARTQVQEFQRQNETAEQRAQREEQERQERITALERENRDLRVGSLVRERADKAKAFNPQTVYTMIQSRIEYDDQGQPTNVDQLLQGLRQSDPYLFRRTDADAGAGQGPEAQPSMTMNDAIRAAAGRPPLPGR